MRSRRSPTGGRAKGMPLNASTPEEVKPDDTQDQKAFPRNRGVRLTLECNKSGNRDLWRRSSFPAFSLVERNCSRTRLSQPPGAGYGIAKCKGGQLHPVSNSRCSKKRGPNGKMSQEDPNLPELRNATIYVVASMYFREASPSYSPMYAGSRSAAKLEGEDLPPL